MISNSTLDDDFPEYNYRRADVDLWGRAKDEGMCIMGLVRM